MAITGGGITGGAGAGSGGTTDNTTQDNIPIKDSGTFENSGISLNTTLDRFESEKTFYAPTLQSDPGSVEVGDAEISSGGREISAKSLSTGNTGAFNIQLYDETSFQDATIFDPTQVSIITNIQVADDGVATGVQTNKFYRIVQQDIQFRSISFKPEGDTITSAFRVIIRIDAVDAVPSYDKVIEPTDSDLTQVGGGLWELVLSNPIIFDQDMEAHIETQDISLLGGNGYAGPINFGDPANSNFFPYLIGAGIPVVRKIIDPDLRSQRRTLVIPATQLGYQASVADGEITAQGWTNNSTGGAIVASIIDPDDGLRTLRFVDDTATGAAKMSRPLGPQFFQDLFDNGGQINFRVKAIRESGDVSLIGIVGFSGANDPGWKAGARGRFMVISSLDVAGKQVISAEGGTEHVINVQDDYINVVVVIEPGTMSADIYADGVLLENFDFSANASNSSSDDLYVFQSLGTATVGQEGYLRESLVTVFETGSTINLTKDEIENNQFVAFPDGVFRDWTVVFPDEDIELGSRGSVSLSDLGTVDLTRAGSEVTFNGQESLKVQGPGEIKVVQTNLDPAAPDKKYLVGFSGGASEINAVTQPPFVLAAPGLTVAEREKLSNQSGINTGDVTLSSDDPTQESLDLTGQEITANQATQTTDGVMSSEDKLKLDNITGNGVADHWVSGLDVTEQSPKDQTVLYTAGTYLINGDLQTIATGGTYDLENGYGSVNHYTGLTSYQHRFVTLYVDTDNVIKSIGGAAADKKDVPPLPTTPVDSVSIALVEIKVDNSAVPKDIKDKEITDTRNAPAFNTDEFVKVSADDQGSGHLSDKLSNNGNVTFTIENAGGIETIKADSGGSAALPSMTYSTDVNIDGLDVSSIAPVGILYTNMAGNRELRSFAGGVEGQVVILINVIDSTIKVKDEVGTYQMIRTEGATDKTFGNYGGTRFVYHAATGYWYMSTAI